ncbi:MAG: alkaline phosphatase family protein [Candidatus Aenigmatarchaeota archaeon]
MLSASKIEDRILKGTKLEGFVTPSYKGFGLANTMPTISHLLGAKIKNQVIFSEDVFDYDAFKGINHIVFILLDGLGYTELKSEMKKNDLNMKSLKEDIVPITSICPSATTSAVTSLATGVTPQEHGIMGYKIYLKEFGLIASTLTLSPILGYVDFMGLGIDPSAFLGIDTIYDHMKNNNIDTEVFLNRNYANTALSQMIYRDTKITPFEDYSKAFGQIADKVKKKSRKMKFTYLYWDLIDSATHQYGTGSPEISELIKAVDRSLFEDFLDKVRNPGTLVIISADHGFVNVDHEKTFYFHDHDELTENLIVPPSGEDRFVYLFVKNGKLDEIKDYIKNNVKNTIAIESEKAIKLGLFGHNEPRIETIGRIGDLILIPKKDNIFTYAYSIEDILFRVKGYHGGLSRNEMLVPLICKRLE